MGPGLGGGGGVALIGARVTPNSGFFVGDGGLGDQESWLRHTGGGLAVVAGGGGGGGGGGAGGVFDAAGGTPLGTGWALLGGGLAVVDAAGVTLVDCSAPRDTSSTADTTIAASATAASVAAAALVRYHGCTTRNSMRSGVQVPIGALAGRSAASAVAGTSSGPVGCAQPVVQRGHRDRLGDRVDRLIIIDVRVIAPRLGVVGVLAGIKRRCAARRGAVNVEGPQKSGRHQGLVGGAAKVAAFHQSIHAPHGLKPNRAPTRLTHRNSGAPCGSLGMRRGADLPSSGRRSEIPVGCAANAAGRIALTPQRNPEIGAGPIGGFSVNMER